MKQTMELDEMNLVLLQDEQLLVEGGVPELLALVATELGIYGAAMGISYSLGYGARMIYNAFK